MGTISLPKPPRGLTAPWVLGFVVVVAWFGYFAPRALAAHGGVPAIIPPIVCINVAIRTYENKSFF